MVRFVLVRLCSGTLRRTSLFHIHISHSLRVVISNCCFMPKDITKMSLDNANPIVYEQKKERELRPEDEDDDVVDQFDDREIFDLIRSINDPEHPLTLEELNVVDCDNIHVNDSEGSVEVLFTPTIPHCSMATLIGLSIRVKLLRALPPRFKVDVKISPGSHASEEAVNKQLADKERVAAALENTHLLEVVNQCLATRKAAT